MAKFKVNVLRLGPGSSLICILKHQNEAFQTSPNEAPVTKYINIKTSVIYIKIVDTAETFIGLAPGPFFLI